jgi:predicted amidohydrolase
MEKIRVAAVQIEHKPGDKQYNLGRIEHFAAKAARAGVRAVAFPECCIPSYMYLESLDYDQLCALADQVPQSDTVSRLKELARAHDIHVLAGLLEVDRGAGGSLYNTYVAVSPAGDVIKYRKLHPFVNANLKAGSEYVQWELEGWRASILICYDCNLWENWRIVELRGAQIVFCPHQTGGFDIPCAGMGKISPELWLNRDRDPEPVRREITGPKGLEWVRKWLPSRAYDTGTYVVFANGIGIDGDDEVRTGGSMIVNPHGIVLAETSEPGDDMVVAELDPKELELNLGKSHTSARRPELYGELAEGAGAGTKEKRDAIRKKLGVDLS